MATIQLSIFETPPRPGILEGRPHKVIFHPTTSLCVQRKSLVDPLILGPCSEAEGWNYTPQKILTIKGTYFCLQAVGTGKPARLSVICSDRPNTKWEMISDSKMHLSSKLANGTTEVCLDVDSDNVVVTNTWKCLSGDRTCDPASQWFKLVDRTRRSSGSKDSVMVPSLDQTVNLSRIVDSASESVGSM
ncbi:glycosyl hydrolase 5 family protein-like [Senna tora]|uniref:Glycosyl hydrolase 5 family protein-like n=1 Tax=Senna tora TaxID=362788 RepID=A0A835CI21_9FABA|nr:glycosyl hydrolase 5 family protein-like [Senna tora]